MSVLILYKEAEFKWICPKDAYPPLNFYDAASGKFIVNYLVNGEIVFSPHLKYSGISFTVVLKQNGKFDHAVISNKMNDNIQFNAILRRIEVGRMMGAEKSLEINGADFIASLKLPFLSHHAGEKIVFDKKEIFVYDNSGVPKRYESSELLYGLKYTIELEKTIVEKLN